MKDYKKRLLKLFVPIMLSNIIAQVQMIIDRIFLGRTDVLYMSAVGNSSTPVWTTMSFVFALSTGSSILISQAIGAGNKENTKKYAASLLIWHNVIPMLLFLFWLFCSPLVFRLMGVADTVIDYCVTYTRIFSPIILLNGVGCAFCVILQTSNNTKPLVWYGLIRSVANIFLDWCLIFGNCGFPEMGIAGAALATTIAELIGAVYITIEIIRNKNLLSKPSFQDLIHASPKLYFESLKLGVNIALEDFTYNFGGILILRILNAISDTAAGVYSIVVSYEVLGIVIIGAIGSATVTLTGEATGAKDFKTYRGIAKTAFLWSACVAGFSLILSLVFPHQILGLFTKDAAIIASASIYLFCVSFNLFGKSGNIIVGSSIRGFGNTKWMFFTQTCGTVLLIGVACLLVFGFHMGMLGVYLAIIADEGIRALVNTGKYMRIKF